MENTRAGGTQIFIGTRCRNSFYWLVLMLFRILSIAEFIIEMQAFSHFKLGKGTRDCESFATRLSDPLAKRDPSS